MADPVGWFDASIAPAGWFSEDSQPGGWLAREMVSAESDGAINGAVANATSATELSAPSGAQTYTGTVSGATSATELANPAGSQAYTGIASPGSTATALSAPTGVQSYLGSVSGAASATALSEPSGTISGGSITGSVSGATSETQLSSPAGSIASSGGGGGGAPWKLKEPRKRNLVYVVKDEPRSSATEAPKLSFAEARQKAEEIIKAAATEHAATRVSKPVRYGYVRASIKPLAEPLGGWNWVNLYQRMYDAAIIEQLKQQEAIADQLEEDSAIAFLLLNM